MPTFTTIHPLTSGDGVMASPYLEALSVEDRYFVRERATAIGMIADQSLAELPDLYRRAIELTVVAGMSYRDAAREMELYLRSGRPDGKKVYRLRAYGLRLIKHDLLNNEWVTALAGHRIPREDEA